MKLKTASFWSKLSKPIKNSLLQIVGLTILSFGFVFLLILPQRQKIHFAQQAIDRLQDEAQKMDRDLASLPTQQAQTRQTQTQLAEVVDLGLLEPLLGSYAMRVKKIIDPLAHQSGLELLNLRELRQIPLPAPTAKSPSTYARQLIEVTALGSYQQIASFVNSAEQMVPLITLAAIKIESQTATPEQHRTLIVFEWPTKIKEEAHDS